MTTSYISLISHDYYPNTRILYRTNFWSCSEATYSPIWISSSKTAEINHWNHLNLALIHTTHNHIFQRRGWLCRTQTDLTSLRMHSPVSTASCSLVFQCLAIFSAKGSSGLGALNRAWMLAATIKWKMSLHAHQQLYQVVYIPIFKQCLRPKYEREYLREVEKGRKRKRRSKYIRLGESGTPLRLTLIELYGSEELGSTYL